MCCVQGGMTALMTACDFTKVRTARKLLELKANPNCVSKVMNGLH